MKLLGIFLLAALCCASPLQAAAPGLNDFAYGLPLPRVEGNGAYSLDLPRVVYEKTTRHDLGDLRVFNGAGETVPHALRRVPGNTAAEQLRQAVPFFPLPGRQLPMAADLSLRVSRNQDGAVVTVDAGSAAAANPAQSSSYLLDTTQLETAPTALELEWDNSSATLFSVSLAHSKDLSHWLPLVGPTTLADLNYNGSTIAARRIVLPGKTLPYIRLDCGDCRQPLLLKAVTAVSGTAASPDQWQWLRLDPEKAGEIQKELVFEYRLEASLTVTALQLRFAQTNSLARAVIESRPAPDAPWQTRVQGDFYSLNLQGKTLSSEPAGCAPTFDRHWRLRVVSDGSGLGGDGGYPVRSTDPADRTRSPANARRRAGAAIAPPQRLVEKNPALGGPDRRGGRAGPHGPDHLPRDAGQEALNTACFPVPIGRHWGSSANSLSSPI